MSGGRPQEYDRGELAKLFLTYIEDTDIPIIAEFAYRNEVTRELLYDWPEFSTLLKKCTQKKESALERLALTNGCNVTMAIFSLKQLGWSDKQDVTHKGDALSPVVISPAAGKW